MYLRIYLSQYLAKAAHTRPWENHFSKFPLRSPNFPSLHFNWENPFTSLHEVPFCAPTAKNSWCLLLRPCIQYWIECIGNFGVRLMHSWIYFDVSYILSIFSLYFCLVKGRLRWDLSWRIQERRLIYLYFTVRSILLCMMLGAWTPLLDMMRDVLRDVNC